MRIIKSGNKAISVFPSSGKFISIPGDGAVEVFEAGAAGYIGEAMSYEDGDIMLFEDGDVMIFD
jgi:hypothetical protein